jgi:hypothetical protein
VAVWLELLLNGQLVGGTHLSGLCLQSGEVIYFTLEIVVLAQVRSRGGSRLIQEPPVNPGHKHSSKQCRSLLLDQSSCFHRGEILSIYLRGLWFKLFRIFSMFSGRVTSMNGNSAGYFFIGTPGRHMTLPSSSPQRSSAIPNPLDDPLRLMRLDFKGTY